MSREFLFPKERKVLQMRSLPQIKGSASWVHVYLCYQEVAGRRATLGELNQILGRINLTEILRIIAIINNASMEIRRPSYIKDPRFQANLETIFFSRDWRKRICDSRWGNTTTECAIFHRQQQLFILRLAIENSPVVGGLAWDEEARYLFGEACLMANDLLAHRGLEEAEIILCQSRSRRSKVVPSNEEQWTIRATTLPTLDFNIGSNPRNDIGRAQRLWIDLPRDPTLRQRAGKDWLDWSTPFAQRYGLSVQDFLNITTALWLYTAEADPNDEHNHRFLLFEPFEVLRQTKLSRESITSALKLLSRSATELKDEWPMMPQQRLGWDLTALRQCPIITLEDGCVVIYDQSFLLAAATDGIYWLIQEALPDTKAFGNMFGHVYEYYVGQVLHRIVPATDPPELPRYHPNPFFGKSTKVSTNKVIGGKNDEVCDGLINCEPLLVLTEVKASLLTTRAKYSGDGDVLQKEIDSKFALTTGTKQLANTIRRLAQGDRPNIPGYNAQAFQRVFPILVSYDKAITTPLLCKYINDVFQEQLGTLASSSRLRAGKVVILSTYEVEALEAICRTKPLLKVLMHFEKTCPIDIPFHMFLQGNYSDLLDGGDVSVADAFFDTTQ